MDQLIPLEKYHLELDLESKDLAATYWRPFLLLQRKGTDEDIAAIEKELEVTLPEDYKQTLKNHGGHIPEPNRMAYRVIDGPNENQWVEDSCGPLYHCIRDCNPDYADYYILDQPFSINNKGKFLAVGETSSGALILLRFPDHVVYVATREMMAVGGENWSDFLRRIRIEGNISAKVKLQKLAKKDIICDGCDETITKSVQWHCTECTESFDLCEACKEKGFVKEPHTAEHKLEQKIPEKKIDFDELLQGMTPYRFSPVPTEEQRAQRELCNKTRRQLPTSNLLYLKWDDDKYEEFEHLVAFDRRINLAARAEYYTLKSMLNHHHHFIDVPLRQERHAVWLPSDPQAGNYFGYSIGAYYLFNEPEILLIHRGQLLTPRQTALAVNFVRTASQFAKPVVAGTRIGDIIDSFSNPEAFAPFKHCEFKVVDELTRREYLGFASWFYCNFMDITEPPALFCELEALPADSV